MIKLGFVPSHRAPFSKDWAVEMRKRTIESIKKNVREVELVYPDENLTDEGLVTFEEDAQKVIKLFKENNIQGLIIGTMTFGEELPNITVAEAFDKVPILIFGTKEGPFTADGNRKSDSFCGTISTASGLTRRKIKFDFAGIYFPEEEDFILDIKRFAKVVVAYNGFMGARVGIVGPRPAPFETCAINEISLIEKFRQRIVTINLLKLYSDINSMKADDRVIEVINEIKKSYDCHLVNKDILLKIAKLELILSDYAQKEDISGYGVQCWTAMQEEIGISSCLSMGRLTDKGIMCACEVDVHGVLTMIIQYLLSLKEAAPHFIDWTIQNQNDENTFLAWHCGNAPVSLKCSSCKPLINSHSVLGWQIGYDKSFGTAEFQLKEGNVTISRLAEVDSKFKMLITTGEAVHDNRNLRGSWKWIKVKDLKKLYRTIIEEGFTHHASLIFGDFREEIKAFCKFVDIEVIELDL
jgi:L-fucose isomerase-like protein